MKGKSESEKGVQRAIIEYLTYKNIFFYRQNSGAIQTQYKGRKGFYRFASMSGLPDIVAIVRGRYIGIECKGSSGSLSESQIKFMDASEHAGGKYILARSLEDVENVLGKNSHSCAADEVDLVRKK